MLTLLLNAHAVQAPTVTGSGRITPPASAIRGYGRVLPPEGQKPRDIQIDIRDLEPLVRSDFALPHTNRFRGHSMYQDAGNLFYGLWSRPDIPVSPDDHYLTVEAGQDGRLDVLSMKFYGTSHLWWVIAIANGLIGTFDEVPAGTILRYPSAVSLAATNVLRLV